MDETAFDSRGLYRGPELTVQAQAQAFLVFAQQGAFDEPRWDSQAKRFFRTQVGYTQAKARIDATMAVGTSDAALVVVAGPDAAPAKRWVFGRNKTELDNLVIERAEADGGLPGMSELSRRCGFVFLVVAESEADSLALTLCAVLASLYTGPIIPPDRSQAYGVQTARRILDRMTQPYR
jgi:hypothetical protein